MHFPFIKWKNKISILTKDIRNKLQIPVEKYFIKRDAKWTKNKRNVQNIPESNRNCRVNLGRSHHQGH